MKNDQWQEEMSERVEAERQAYRGPHCCMTMHYELLSDEGVLLYNPQFREYGIKPYKSKNYLVMKHCMVCGKRLPASLQSTWFKVLKDEYQLTDPMGKDKKLIPKKFLSEEWWNPDKTLNNYRIGEDIVNNREIEDFDYVATHCCDLMDWELLNNSSPLMYTAKYREYDVKIINSEVSAAADYCIFCGKNLPESVRDEWYDILEQEYALEGSCEEDKKKAPAEFFSDEWSKVRGL